MRANALFGRAWCLATTGRRAEAEAATEALRAELPDHPDLPRLEALLVEGDAPTDTGDPGDTDG